MSANAKTETPVSLPLMAYFGDKTKEQYNSFAKLLETSATTGDAYKHYPICAAYIASPVYANLLEVMPEDRIEHDIKGKKISLTLRDLADVVELTGKIQELNTLREGILYPTSDTKAESLIVVLPDAIQERVDRLLKEKAEREAKEAKEAEKSGESA